MNFHRDSLPPGSLRIRNAYRIESKGVINHRQWVYCPFRGRSVTLDECAECYDFESVAGDDGKATKVHCRRVPVDDEARKEGQTGAHAAIREPVSTAATRDLVCVRSDVPVGTLSEMLLEYDADAAAVIDHRGWPIGLVSKTDVVRGMLDGSGAPRRPLEQDPADPRGTVGAIMTPAVLAVQQTTALGEAAALMAEKGIHQLPVVSDNGEVVAMLTSRDVLRTLAGAEGFSFPPKPQSP